MTLTVGTYNIRGMKDDVAALTRVIRAMRADVVCVQEAPRFVGWRRSRMRLAESAGLRVAAGLRLGGVAVLIAPGVRLLHTESRLLKIFLGLEIRAVAIAVVEVEGARFAVGSIHLDLDEAARLHHATEAVTMIEQVAARFGAAIVLAGDINEQDDRTTWRYLAGRLSDCYPRAPKGNGMTFTARSPGKRIDAIFAAQGLRVAWCGGVEADPADLVAATDHLPVVAGLVRG
ncbi:endonuclease/exonuclease/phosphatase family protein [Nonomuraea africana]|uniref:Endonuclease/exonuclease/phosphatase family metal-dependent hydrolase n=1 Tax=Nonomuraea africana TaxID=46171 RepID=A0ABR9KHZ7_9ACTN|nr:endonuclease/exonuclease/phosphatase family protein [Nonomuraea africana]MBE1561580.1 endonuclease/exonuclease/phosphatase family metal-dependent hydrolase [Nonomuraea africana]